MNIFAHIVAVNVIADIITVVAIIVLAFQRHLQIPTFPPMMNDLELAEVADISSFKFKKEKFDWIYFSLSIGSLLFTTHLWCTGPTVTLRFIGMDTSPIRNWNSLLVLVVGWIGLLIITLPGIPEQGNYHDTLKHHSFLIYIL